MPGREVITFQFGNYSNYIGAHWWNIQESYFTYDAKNPSDVLHDVLFREGKTSKGSVTFTPRVIIMDRTENLINVPTLLETPQNVSTENLGNISVVELPNVQTKHEFIRDLEKLEKGQRVDLAQKDYKFDETVRSWSDYLKTRYHPNSMCTFPSVFPTEIFHSGIEIYNNVEESLIEKIRSYMEECDNLQGFQMLVDPTDAFGGLGNATLIHLQDEYSRKSIVTVPAIAGHFSNASPMDDIKRTINLLLSYQKLTEDSSLLVPLGTNKTAWRSLGLPIDFPNIIYNHSKPYHTSAILASFLDTVTLKYRLREEYYYMEDIISGLNFYNKKVCAATISLPFPIAPDSYLLDTLENLDDSLPLWSQLTPGCNVTDDAIFYQKITIRGIPTERLKNPNSQSSSRAHLCTNIEELVHMYLSFRLSAISDVTSVRLPLKTSIPYPKIFSQHVSSTGAVDDNATRAEGLDVKSCPVITGLHCCKAVGRMCDSLHQCVKTVNIKRFHQFFGAYMDLDEFNECLEKFLSMGYGRASEVELR